jgi:hypothetical protein
MSISPQIKSLLDDMQTFVDRGTMINSENISYDEKVKKLEFLSAELDLE